MGYLELPRRRIHAGLWFRILRTLLDELNTPLSTCGTYAGYIRHVWEGCGYPLRAAQSLWRPYETLDPAVQLQMLEAATTAIHLIETRVINPPGGAGKAILVGATNRFHQRPAHEGAEAEARQLLAGGGQGDQRSSRRSSAQPRDNPLTVRVGSLWAAARPRVPGTFVCRVCQGRHSAGIPVT